MRVKESDRRAERSTVRGSRWLLRKSRVREELPSASKRSQPRASIIIFVSVLTRVDNAIWIHHNRFHAKANSRQDIYKRVTITLECANEILIRLVYAEAKKNEEQSRGENGITGEKFCARFYLRRVGQSRLPTNRLENRRKNQRVNEHVDKF